MKHLSFASIFALAVLAVTGLADSTTASPRDFPPPDDPGQFNVGVTTFLATMSAGRVTRIQVYYPTLEPADAESSYTIRTPGYAKRKDLEAVVEIEP